MIPALSGIVARFKHDVNGRAHYSSMPVIAFGCVDPLIVNNDGIAGNLDDYTGKYRIYHPDVATVKAAEARRTAQGTGEVS